MKVLWPRRARAEFNAAIDYLQQHSPAGARRIAEDIERSVLLVETFPHIAPASRHKGLRQKTVPSTPYIIVYRIKSDQIEIRAVIHTGQRRRR